MQGLAKPPHSKEEVIRALETSGRSVKFRYELLDRQLKGIGWLDSVESGKVENNHLAQVKRTSNFDLRGDSVQGINFITDRIRPHFDLLMETGEVTSQVEVPPDPYQDVILADGPVGYWRLGEAEGTVATDSSVKGSNGTYTNTPTLGVAGVIVDDPNTAVTFSRAAAEHVRVSNTVHSGANALSAEGWVRLASLGMGRQTIVSWGEGNSKGIVFSAVHDSTEANASVWFHVSGGWRNLQVARGIGAGEWFYMAATYDGTTIRLYINGTQVGSLAYTGTLDSPNGTALGIGSRSSWDTHYLDGTLDEVAIYDRALTAEEIKEHYKAGKNTLRKYQTMTSKTYDWVSWPLGTFMLESSSERITDQGTRRSVKGFDQLLILKEDNFTNRYAIPKGVGIRAKVIDIIESAGIRNHSISDSTAVTPFALEWPIGTPKLEVINELLRAMGFGTLYFSAAGVAVGQPWTSPFEQGYEYHYTANIIAPDIDVTLDLARVPNQWVAYTSSSEGIALRSVFTNTSTESPTSTVNRGRIVSAAPIRATAADQAALDSIVRRKAEADSQVYQETKFTTIKMPHHGDGDVLRLTAHHASLDFTAQERSWSMDLKPGGVMEHVIQKLVII